MRSSCSPLPCNSASQIKANMGGFSNIHFGSGGGAQYNSAAPSEAHLRRPSSESQHSGSSCTTQSRSISSDASNTSCRSLHLASDKPAGATTHVQSLTNGNFLPSMRADEPNRPLTMASPQAARDIPLVERLPYPADDVASPFRAMPRKLDWAVPHGPPVGNWRQAMADAAADI